MIRFVFSIFFVIFLAIIGSSEQVFADHTSVMVSTPQGTSVPGCEETNECFIPYMVTVDVGGEVTWSNDDTAAHTVTAGSAADGPSGEFDSSLFMAGTTFSHTFEYAGEFPYHCMVHPWMAGIVVVEGGGESNIPLDVTPPKILQPKDIEVDAENFNGVRVSFDVLVIDDFDRLIQPSCTPHSGSFFDVGDTIVKCSARDSAGNYATSISFTVTVIPPGFSIPSWVKEVAEFWCEDKIDDGAFVEGIQYLIDNGIIVVPATSLSYSSSYEIPQWIKNNACWWAAGMITDEDFAFGIEYLINQGIIIV